MIITCDILIFSNLFLTFNDFIGESCKMNLPVVYLKNNIALIECNNRSVKVEIDLPEKKKRNYL